GARVADMADDDALVLDERDGHRRSHTGGRGVGARPLVDAAVCLLDERCDALGPGEAARIGVLERRGSELRRHLARLRAAHAVRDREERRSENVRVLVTAPATARVRAAGIGADDRHASNLRSVSPTRTTSPGARRRAPSMRMPFTYVPFVEPRSCTQTPSLRGSKRTCREDANSSPSSARSFWPPRPTVIGAESTSSSSPSSSTGLSCTTSFPPVG